ncbi:MAG TPA: hypothetical protein VED87_10010, partial [Methylocystis sp.]|nr:hypothetical protein [Methylocystis sp.]
FGGRDLSRSTQGAAFFGKLALAGAHKLARRVFVKSLPLSIDFRVAPQAAHGFEDIAPQALTK